MDILEATFFPGPNRHVLRPCFEARVRLGHYGQEPTSAHYAFQDRLIAALPGLDEHYCSRGHHGGFVERLREGTYLGHVAEHVALECLYLSGERGVYGKTREIDRDTVSIVFESETAEGGRGSLQLAIDLVCAFWDDIGVDVGQRLALFRHELAQHRLGPSTRALVEAARKKDIPVSRLDDHNLIRLGQGVRQRRLMATMADGTSIVGVEVAQDKALTARLLEDAGIPVPKGILVTSVTEAEQVLAQWAGPCVLKPVDGHYGRGVMMNILTPDHLRRAYEAARSVSQKPLRLEQQLPGIAYRLLVVGDAVVAATERRVPQVVGDGMHSVKALVEALNQDPRRGPDHGFPMSWAPWDDEALETLAAEGWTPESVVPAGVVVKLRRTANMSTGASAHDVTAEVSMALARDAIRAAHAVGVDIAGVDLVTPRLDCSLREAGGGVVEVNAAPGLRMHLYPAEGNPRSVAERIVDYLFPSHHGRIPVAAVTGTNGKTTVTRMLGHIGGRAGFRVGMSTTDGIAIGGETIQTGDLTGPWSARLVLNDPSVEMAILETARGGMARGGLGFDDLDVAVVTNIGGDHLGQDGVETLDDLIHLKGLLVEVVRPSGKAVLNADDPHVLGLKDRCRGRIVLFSTANDNPEVAVHLESGGEAVYIKHGCLYYGSGGESTRLIGTRALPASLGGVASINVANAAAAAAAALALGMTPRQVADGLKSFPVGGAGLNRGRLEMLEGSDVRVLVDYGHNVPAITALGEICGRLRPRAIVTVVGLPGDRRTDDIQKSAQVVAGFSHRVVIREDADLRDRAPGEVAGLIRDAILAVDFPESAIDVVLDEGQSVREAIRSALPGSLVLVLYEKYAVVRQAAEEALMEREALIKGQPEDLLEHA